MVEFWRLVSAWPSPPLNLSHCPSKSTGSLSAMMASLPDWRIGPSLSHIRWVDGGKAGFSLPTGLLDCVVAGVLHAHLQAWASAVDQ